MPSFDRNTRRRPKLSLTSLIDLVFLLVVFFMITTTFVDEQSINLNFATDEGAAAASPDLTNTVLVQVFAGGGITMNGKPFALSNVRESIRLLLQHKPDALLMVSADDAATVQDLVSAVDQLSLGGGRNITLAK